jgi:hypothetical protein
MDPEAAPDDAAPPPDDNRIRLKHVADAPVWVQVLSFGSPKQSLYPVAGPGERVLSWPEFYEATGHPELAFRYTLRKTLMGVLFMGALAPILLSPVVFCGYFAGALPVAVLSELARSQGTLLGNVLVVGFPALYVAAGLLMVGWMVAFPFLLSAAALVVSPFWMIYGADEELEAMADPQKP